MSSRRKNVEQIRQSLCGRDRVAEQPRAPLAEHRRDLVVQRIPLQQRVERDRRVRERPFHVRHPAAGGHVRGGQLAGGRGRGGLVDRGDAGHAAILGLADAPVSALMASCESFIREASSPGIGSSRSSARTTAPPCCWRATRWTSAPSTLHVAGEPPGALSTTRFLERAHRLGSVAHPHLLGVYGARTLEGRAVAVAQAPPGRRLDELIADGPIGAGPAVRIVRQVASAVDALEDAGAEPPPLTPNGSGSTVPATRTSTGSTRAARAASRPRPRPRRRWRAGRRDDRPRPGALGTSSRARSKALTCRPGSSRRRWRPVEAGAERRRRITVVAVALAAALVVAAVLIVLVAAGVQSIGSNSLSFQVWSNHGCSGP